jgi:hypothetical protein
MGTAMADNRRGPPTDGRPRKQTQQASRPQRPFDVWLNRQLHAMYDDIAREPLPSDVVELIERDGRAHEAGVVSEGGASDDAAHQQASPDDAVRRDKS